jgi:hypothetical protein
MINRFILLGALLIPAAAIAQPADPDAPPPPPPAQELPPPQATLVVEPAPPPPPPATAETTTVTVSPPAATYEVVEDSYNAPMFTSGALVFAASYGASAITAASTDDARGNHRLYVPLVGPWLALSDRGSCDVSLSKCDNETTAKVLLVADGVFQAAGVLAMLDGIFQPSSRRVITRTARLDTKVHVAPTAAHGDPGVSVFGRF